MIRLSNVNKYFFKNKENEIHVSKDINLEIDSKGMVVFLGTSGSGKTTLLNIMSGIDRFDSGEIEVFGEKLSHFSRKWNKIRKNNIGYVFQNYNLLKNKTVYENIDFILRNNGYNDEENIRSRIQYLLKSVGLENFEKRYVNTLSGGQAQRVSLARALVKRPKIIVADEPTGNLDSKNSLFVMNILKEFSKSALVLLVTHDEKIASYYGDRIIRIKDGEIISDELNEANQDINMGHEQQIFLKDYNKEEIRSDNVEVAAYGVRDVRLKLIDKSDTLYIGVDSSNRRVKYIDDFMDVDLIDDSSKNSNKYITSDFDINKLEEIKTSKRLSLKNAFKYAIRNLSDLTLSKKLTYFILMISGALLALSMGIFSSINTISDSVVVKRNRNYIVVNDDITLEEIRTLKQDGIIKDFNVFLEPVEFNLSTEKYYQVNNALEIEAHPSDIITLSEDKILYGKYPEEDEIVIDISLANKMIYENSQRGIETYTDILKSKIKLQVSGSEYDYSSDTYLEYDIVGIANDNSPTVWMDRELMYSLSAPSLVDHTILGSMFVLDMGELPSYPKEVLMFNEDGIISTFSKVGTSLGTLDVSGTYSLYKEDRRIPSQLMFVSTTEMIEDLMFHRKNIVYGKSVFLAYVDDVDASLAYFEENGIYAYSEYRQSYDAYIADKQLADQEFRLYAIIGIASSIVGVLFVMRSNIISRLYSISVLRSIGVSTKDLTKIFIFEILTVTTISTLIGYLASVGFLSYLSSGAGRYIDYVEYSAYNVGIGIVILYAISIVFGIIPVLLLNLRTPAQLMTKHDM